VFPPIPKWGWLPHEPGRRPREFGRRPHEPDRRPRLSHPVE
jgi:hypothetical protein